MRHLVNHCCELPLENMSEWTKEEDMSRKAPPRVCAQVKSYELWKNPILAIVTPFWLGEERGDNFTIVIEFNRMHRWRFNDHDVINRFKWLKWQCCAIVITWCAVGENMLDCKGGSQEKWSSGLREASPTDHNGDVPNGYVRRARTPLRWWCNWIPILAIPILAIHPDWDPNFSDPNFSNPNFSDPDLGNELKESDNWHFQKKECQKCQTPTFCEVSLSITGRVICDTAWYQKSLRVSKSAPLWKWQKRLLNSNCI
jgi:hypothetical protein